MKNKSILAISLGIAILISGCTSKDPQKIKAELDEEKKEEVKGLIDELPKWVIAPEVKGSIAAVGMTKLSKHGLHTMLTLAEMDARAKLAGQIQTTVSQLQERSIRKIQIENIDDLEDIFSQVTKEVIKEIPISGAKRVNIHQAEDGSLYVLMTIDNTDIKKILEQNRGVYKKHMENAKIAKDNLDQGMLVLDNMIDRLEIAKED